VIAPRALLIALVLLGATRGSCPMRLDAGVKEPTAHGCCGEGLTSKPPSCCDSSARTPDARTPVDACSSPVPVEREFPFAPGPAQVRDLLAGAWTPLVSVHSPPISILRI
jgi:hypothetical protein